MTSDLSLSEPAGSRSLRRLVRSSSGLFRPESRIVTRVKEEMPSHVQEPSFTPANEEVAGGEK